MSLLSIENLKTHFFTKAGVVKSVDGVSFDLERGEILGIVGESGSGKSTLLKVLSGLYAPSEGRILLDGTDMSQIEPRDLRGIGQVGRHITVSDHCFFMGWSVAHPVDHAHGRSPLRTCGKPAMTFTTSPACAASFWFSRPW